MSNTAEKLREYANRAPRLAVGDLRAAAWVHERLSTASDAENSGTNPSLSEASRETK
jgi:hypothetical protein